MTEFPSMVQELSFGLMITKVLVVFSNPRLRWIRLLSLGVPYSLNYQNASYFYHILDSTQFAVEDVLKKDNIFQRI